MPAVWTAADLVARGWGLDGRRIAPEPACPGAPAAPAPHPAGGSPAPKPLSTATLRRLTPEQRLQIEVVRLYRPLLRPDARLMGINGELPGGGRLTALRAAVRREMGYQRGCADMLARRPGHLLWLEAKVGTDASDDQARFADWAHGIGDGYAVFTGVEDAGVLLRIHGMLAA